MVKHDAGEVAVNTIIDVDHVALAIKSRVLNCTAGNDVAGNGEGGGDVVAAWLSNDVDTVASREELIQGISENASHLLKGLATETATHVEGTHGEAKFGSLLENGMGISDSLVESQGVRST